VNGPRRSRTCDLGIKSAASVIAADAAFLTPPRVGAKRLVLFVVSRRHGPYVEDDVKGIVATYVSTPAHRRDSIRSLSSAS
jgi:hypothetical protein